HPLHPFDDLDPLHHLARKYDASLAVVGTHSKKRPHAITFVRCFDGEVMDMVEVGVRGWEAMEEFKVGWCGRGGGGHGHGLGIDDDNDDDPHARLPHLVAESGRREADSPGGTRRDGTPVRDGGREVEAGGRGEVEGGHQGAQGGQGGWWVEEGYGAGGLWEGKMVGSGWGCVGLEWFSKAESCGWYGVGTGMSQSGCRTGLRKDPLVVVK
ncbi:rRNA-binding ribosome biosynthesis protein rpf2, partial [Gonapodya sp. JEL0774]